ncbi:MAG TPA: LPS assembly lipoprotein LptE, partial [Candidatus Aminicenantes bacterium]|nr:LPS assembly lipoprotein LptE [Candidatus Aminicenantes bacterium]
EMVAPGKVELTADTEGADAILTGEIVMFAVNPIAFSQQATADRYNITVVARIVMRDLVNQKVLFSNPSFIYVEEYEVPSGTNFEAMETEAIDKIAEKFGRQVVVNILEGF